MKLVWILTRFDGRLNRKPYWIVSLILLALAIILLGMITAISIQTPQTGLVLGLTILIQFILFYLSAALMAKRFHDLDKSAAYVLLQIGPIILGMVTDFLGITGKPVALSAIDLEASMFDTWIAVNQWQSVNQPLDFALNWWIFAVTIWFLIELGFRRGTAGANRFGPDPLAGPKPA